jgi:spermidine/putrescine transport system permease protein
MTDTANLRRGEPDEARHRSSTRDGTGTPVPWAILPSVALQLALFAAPLAIMLLYSFWTSRNYQIVAEWTLDNYKTFFASWTYPWVLFRTLWTSFIITTVTLLAAYPFTYFIVRYTSRWQKVLIGLVILSFWTSGLLRAYAWMAILGNGGIINKGLQMLGLIDGPLPFLIYSTFATVLVMTYFSFPFAVIALYTSLERMDWTLVQAANDLGASPARAFLHVTLPQTMPGVISASVLTFVTAIGMFFVPLLVGSSSSIMIAPLISNQMQAFQLGLGAALSFIIALIVMTILAAAWRYVEPKH